MQIGSNRFGFEMNVTLNRLKHYVEFNWLLDELTERITALQLTVVAALKSERGSVSRSHLTTDASHREHPYLDASRRPAGRRPALCLGSGLAVVFALARSTLVPHANASPLKTQNIFLIISDGFRWQEVFDGADADLMTKENGGVKDTNALR